MRTPHLTSVCALFFLLIAGTAYGGEPTLAVQVTVPVDGEQVTLYRDKDESARTLYYMPSRLTLRKDQKGKRMVNLALIRGLVDVVQRGQTFDDVRAGKRAGGVFDAYLQIRGVDDLGRLRAKLGELYPAYADYDIAQVPLLPGSASVAVSSLGVFADDPAASLDNSTRAAVKTASSGGPISEQFGGVIPVRFRLSIYDAVLLEEALKQNHNFSAGFDVSLTAKARMWMPASKVNITCNKRQVYEYVESHFKAKGGIAFWSFSADIRKIRQSLEKSGALTVKIEDAGNAAYGPQVLQGIADKWVENFVLKEMFTNQPPLATGKAEAADPPERRSRWFGWADLGTSYAKVDIKDVRNETMTFNFEFTGVVEFPVYGNADFGGITKDDITYVDLNRNFFTYLSLAVVPFDRDVLESQDFRSMTVTIDAKAAKGGEGETRTADFSKYRPGLYQTLVPWMIRADTGARTVTAKAEDVTYSVRMDSARQKAIELKNRVYKHSNWEFDTPTIYLANDISYTSIRVLPQVWNKYRNLEQVTVKVTTADDAEPLRFQFDGAQNLKRYVFYAKDSQKPIKSIEVTASYDERGHPELSRVLPSPGNIDELTLRAGDIPGLDEHGGARNRD